MFAVLRARVVVLQLLLELDGAVQYRPAAEGCYSQALLPTTCLSLSATGTPSVLIYVVSSLSDDAGISPSARTAAIVVPVVVGVLLLAGLAAWLCIRRRRKQRALQPRHPKDIEAGRRYMHELVGVGPAGNQRHPRQGETVSALTQLYRRFWSTVIDSVSWCNGSMQGAIWCVCIGACIGRRS